MRTIQHQLLIDAPVATVYDAIASADGISTWWDKQTPRQTERGLVLEHNPGPEHGIVKLRVVELIPNELDELISCSAGICPKLRSSGAVTSDAITSGLAPGSWVVTWMVGKSTCGKDEIGSQR